MPSGRREGAGHQPQDATVARGDAHTSPLAHLHAIARAPRAAGSAEERDAREYCAGVLRGVGFEVTLQRFEYSQLPGRYGTPVGGALAAATVLIAAWLGAQGAAREAATTLVVGLSLVALWARRMLGDGVLDLPWLRATSSNLVATRGDALPRVWLVAHVDSKSQPIPSALRVAGIVLLVTGIVVALLALLVTLAGAPPRTLWWIGAALAMAGGVPVMASVVGNASDGAVDNASGVAAVLTAAQSLGAVAPVGVLIPSAEELGLAGARAWARAWAGARGVAINCDGVDDEGALTIMHSAVPPLEVIDAIRRVAQQPVRVRRMPLGLLLDSAALGDAGWKSVTVSYGSLGTLRRVHTRADSLAHLRGDGIEGTARVLARAAEELAR